MAAAGSRAATSHIRVALLMSGVSDALTGGDWAPRVGQVFQDGQEKGGYWPP